MGQSYPQANRRDTVRSPLESTFPIRQVTGRDAEAATGLGDSSPILPLQVAPVSKTPKWGIAAILGLMILLGVLIQFRLSDQDRSWTRWEKHELNGVVLGQSPDQPASAAPAQAEAAPRQSSVPPMWSQSRQPRAESQRTPRELGQVSTLGRQTETSEAAVEADPFAAGSSAAYQPPRRIAELQEATPRSIFEAEEVASEPKAKSPQSDPAALDFTASRLPGNSAPRSTPLPRVQQAAGELDQAESIFPEPVPVQRRPALNNDLPAGLPSVPPQQISERRNQSTPAPIGRELPAIDSEPTLSLPASEPRNMAQPSLGNLEPLPLQNMPPQAAPQGNQIESLDLNPPVQNTMNQLPDPQVEAALPVQTAPLTEVDPNFTSRELQPKSNPRRQYNENLPQVAPQRPASANLSTTEAPEKEIAEDEIHQVQSGDNYWTISRRYYSSARFFSALAEYNKHRIPAPEKMKPGMFVLVPDVEVLHQRYPQLTGGGPRDPNETAPAGFFVDPQGQPCYRIGKGDTLTDVAQKHLGRSSRWVQIHAMNKDRIGDGRTLKIGTVLRLPPDASQVVRAPSGVENR